MKNILLVAYLIILSNFLKSNSHLIDSDNDSTILKFKNFAYNYKPTLIDGVDTLVVPRLPFLEDELNNSLYNMFEKKIDLVDDYAFLIISKLYYDQKTQAHFSYDMCYANHNAILDICISRIQNLDSSFVIYECFDVTTWDIYYWASKNKNIFNDEKLLETLQEIDLYLTKKYPKD